MPILGFRGMGVNAAVAGFGQASLCAQVVVFTNAAGAAPRFTCCGEVMATDDTSSGNIQNKWLSFGWQMCNTARGGHRVGNDSSGRSLPLELAGKHIHLKVNCGTFFASTAQECDVEFEVKEMGADGNTGNTLYKFEGLMPVSSDRITSDLDVSGRFRPVEGQDTRATVATQVY